MHSTLTRPIRIPPLASSVGMTVFFRGERKGMIEIKEIGGIEEFSEVQEKERKLFKVSEKVFLVDLQKMTLYI